MITLNDYLYSGDTVLKILQKYTRDLRKEAKLTHNEIDMMHVNFLIQITELLEHNDFLTAQSQKIREFYKYMAHEYPFLAFTFKGRIKSLIRAEEKFNGYIVEYIYDYYTKHGTYPPVSELKNKLSCFRDFIAYRIVLCMPKCHLKPGEDQETASIRYLYEIANVLPGFLEERGFTVESAYGVKKSTSPLLNEDVKMYYRDYICGTSGEGYQSLHITVYDNSSRSFMEVQLRTQKMDDTAEIGPANHLGYEKKQQEWIPANCLIIAMYGATAAKVAINRIPLTTNQACCNLEIDESKADLRYVFHWMSREYLKLKDMGQGSQSNINAVIVKNYPIPLPSIEEQKRISDVLDKWYSLVKSTEIGIPAEIEARKIQYEYYRNTLLQFKEKI